MTVPEDRRSEEEFESRVGESTDGSNPSSWIDRLVDWIVRRPGPAWFAFLVLFVTLGLLAHVGFWVSGSQAVGSFHLELFLNQLWMVGILYFHHLLDQDAENALKEFRPLMEASDEQFAREVSLFTNLPSGPVRILTLISVPIGLYLAFPDDTPFSGDVSSTLAVVSVISTSLALIFAYRILRQLRMVSRFYLQAPAIDLYDLGPVYALSSHSAKTGLVLVLAIHANILIAPEALEVSSLLILVVVLTLLASAAFLLPLRGINRRLVEEKKKSLQSTQSRLNQAFERINLAFDNNELGEIPILNAVASALQDQKTFVESIPTWPWQASTLRGFITLVLLPILVWGVQQVLSLVFNL